eukprot:SAG31_NODE_22807_length_517_cov_0.995215_1_plen_76_part_10
MQWLAQQTAGFGIGRGSVVLQTRHAAQCLLPPRGGCIGTASSLGIDVCRCSANGGGPGGGPGGLMLRTVRITFAGE